MPLEASCDCNDCQAAIVTTPSDTCEGREVVALVDGDSLFICESDAGNNKSFVDVDSATGLIHDF